MNIFVGLMALLFGFASSNVVVGQNTTVEEYNEYEEVSEFEARIVPSEEKVNADPRNSFGQFFGFELPEGAVIENYDYFIAGNEPNYCAVISCSDEALEEMTAHLDDLYFLTSPDEDEEAELCLGYLSERAKWWELKELSQNVTIYASTERHYVSNCKCLASRYLYIATGTDETKMVYAVRAAHIDVE